ncbi:MAG: hypothetical protein HQM10_13675 [Candidatus Riflebacteria bacterium]|nr:hypothetical protein [Candidatus Riflebacteria bacterium]
MKILINNEQITFDGLKEVSSIADIVSLVERELEKKDFSLMRLEVDGAVVSPDNLVDLEVRSVSETGELNLVAMSHAEIVREAIADAPEAFQYIEDLSFQVVSDLRLGNTREALEKYVELIDAMTWISTILKTAPLGFAKYMSETNLESERQSLFKRFVEQMNVLSISQKDQDWVGVADIIEYEYPDIFREIRTFFGKLENALMI